MAGVDSDHSSRGADNGLKKKMVGRSGHICGWREKNRRASSSGILTGLYCLD